MGSDVTKSKVSGNSIAVSRGHPLLVGNELYRNHNGLVTCLGTKTGKEYWRARVGGSHSASPIYADGRIYFLSEEGETVVVAPGQQLKHLATNLIDGRTLASMAVSGGSIFIRSETHLYRIGN